MVVHIENDLLLANGEGVGEFDILDRRADGNGICAAVQNPRAVPLVIGLQPILGNGDGHGFGLIRCKETRLCKATQLQLGLLESGLGLGYVALDDLPSCRLARVGHGNRNGDATVLVVLENRVGVGEACIGQAVSEGVRHIHAKGLVVAVAHVDVLIVGHVVETAGEIIVSGGGFKSQRPRGCELAGGIDFAGQNVCHGMARLLACVTHVQDGIHHALPGGGLYGIARIDQHRHLFSLGMERLGHTGDHIQLGLI